MQTEEMTEGLAVVDYILPTNAAAGTYNSAKGIDMSKFARAIFIIEVGAMAASGTLNAFVQSSASATFASGVHNMVNAAITQIVNTAPNCLVTVEVFANAVINENYSDRYIRLQTVVGTAAVYYGVVGLGGEAIEKPAKNQNLNTTLLPQQLVVAS
jgi:hypothetical protein